MNPPIKIAFAEKRKVFCVRKIRKTALVLLIAALSVLLLFTGCGNSDDEISAADVPFVPVYSTGSYGEYLQNHVRASSPDVTVDVDLVNGLTASEGISYKTVDGRDSVLYSDEDGYFEFKVNVPEAGMYSFKVNYYPVAGKSSAIERSITVNGESFYNEASTASLDRIYVDDVKDFKDLDNFYIKDSAGNESKHSQVERPKWIDGAYFEDGTHYYNGALQFYLEKGENTIRFTSLREPVAISAMQLVGAPETLSYDEFLLKHIGLPTDGTAVIHKEQAEYPTSKNDPTLYASNDRTSPGTEPSSVNTIKMNTMGGNSSGDPRWSLLGQWVEYTVDVPKEGLYKISFRARQNTLMGGFASRAIYINDELQYDEAQNVKFNFDSDWQIVTPTDEYGSSLLFYFKEGTNTIRFKAVCGDMTEIINAVENVVSKLNTDYRKILMLTGSSPDQYRDYEFEKEIPEVISDLKAQADILKSVYDALIDILGEEGQQTATLQNIFNQLYTMYENPSSLAKYFSSFKTNITNLSTWLQDISSQPLEIDYFVISENNAAEPNAEAGFFQGLWYQTKMFFSSFVTDFNAVGGSAGVDYDKNVTVWTLSARDQATVLRSVVDSLYVSQYQTNVDLSLVPTGALLPSILAGKGPDVALGISTEDVINYAARSALEPLNNYEGFDEVKERFVKNIIESSLSLKLNDKETYAYGLPEAMPFAMMFYRTDILEELGVEVPTTWDEVFDLIPLLQKRYMEFAPPDYGTLLYQYGGQYYKYDGEATDIDSENGISAFIKYTDFYTNYKIPVSFEFSNRFRTGEMPMGVTELYTFYNKISVFAPEIKGEWTLAPVPGVKQEDGTVNNTVLSQYTDGAGTTTKTTSAVIVKASKNKDAAWSFINWWTSDEAQTEFGREIESVLGSAGRYNSANKTAVMNMNWTKSELDAIQKQWDSIVGYPEVPGGYIMTRYVQFSFNSVAVNYEDARETLLDNVKFINDEIIYKRQDLKLPFYYVNTDN